MSTTNRMNINAAARWAERKDCVWINGDYNNPMYAAVDQNDNRVDCLGSYEKCSAYILAHPGGWWRLYSLDEVLQGQYEEACEAACYLGVREEGISWEAV